MKDNTTTITSHPASYSDAEDAHLLIATDKGLESPAVVRARDLCAQHIAKFYPEWKQLNIIASGDTEEISKMRAFITACRDWSNAESQDFQELYGLKP